MDQIGGSATDKEKDEKASSPKNCSSVKTNNKIDVDNDDDDEGFFAEVGFMFESNQPMRLERFQWSVPENEQTVPQPSESDAMGTSETKTKSRRISVALHVADDIPGAVQSGHYLWPAAEFLCDYLVERYSRSIRDQQNDDWHRQAVTVLELGAGCALVTLTVLQLWQETLQCLCVTDHDRGTLERARDNLETTVQSLLEGENVDDDEEEEEDHLLATINDIVSIPVEFEALEWGDLEAVDSLLTHVIQSHVVANTDHDRNNNDIFANSTATTTACVSVVLGSDLIYCAPVVEPLFRTAAQLIGTGPGSGRFLLSQSFAYDSATEAEIDRVCSSLGLCRVILVDEDCETTGDRVKRIQEFTTMQH